MSDGGKPVGLHLPERRANMNMLYFEKLEEKSHILYCGICSFWLKKREASQRKV